MNSFWLLYLCKKVKLKIWKFFKSGSSRKWYKFYIIMERLNEREGSSRLNTHIMLCNNGLSSCLWLYYSTMWILVGSMISYAPNLGFEGAPQHNTTIDPRNMKHGHTRSGFELYYNRLKLLVGQWFFCSATLGLDTTTTKPWNMIMLLISEIRKKMKNWLGCQRRENKPSV